MSCDQIAVALVRTVKSTCSQSNHSRISVEMDSHADTCVVSSNVLIIHDHEQFADVYSFGKTVRHTNATAIDAVIAYEDPVMHSTLIIMIKQAIKIDSMPEILICPMQCGVHGTTVIECPKHRSASSPRTIIPSWFMILTAVAHPSPPPSPWMVLPFTLRPDVPALQRRRTRIFPSTTSCPTAHSGTPILPCILHRRMTWLITADT